MARIVIKTPAELAALEHKPRRSAPRTVEYSPLTVTQALVVRALLSPQRTLIITPPQRGSIRLTRDVLPVKYQTFNRLQELGALVLDPVESQPGKREVYRLGEQGRALWSEHCRIEGAPRYDPDID